MATSEFCRAHDKVNDSVIEVRTLVESKLIPQNVEILKLLRGESGMNGLVGRVENIENSNEMILMILQGKGTSANPGLIERIKVLETEQAAMRSIKDRGKGLLLGLSLAGGVGGFGIGAAAWKIMSLFF